MALSSATVRTSADVFIADITATADADVGPLAVAHPFGSVPLEVGIVPLQVEFYLSTWIVSAITNAAVSLTKANAVGSGVAGAQARLIVKVDPYRNR